MTKNTTITKYTINFLISKYGKVKSNGIRFFLLLSISLLGACTGIRTMHGLSQQYVAANNTNNPGNPDGISTTKLPHQCTTTKRQSDLYFEVFDAFKNCFITSTNGCSYVCAWLGEYMYEDLGAWVGTGIGWGVGAGLDIAFKHLPKMPLCGTEDCNVRNQEGSQGSWVNCTRLCRQLGN